MRAYGSVNRSSHYHCGCGTCTTAQVPRQVCVGSSRVQSDDARCCLFQVKPSITRLAMERRTVGEQTGLLTAVTVATIYLSVTIGHRHCCGLIIA